MPRVTVELPDGLHRELKQTAKANHRSLHGEMLHRLAKKQKQPTFNDLKQGVHYAANL